VKHPKLVYGFIAVIGFSFLCMGFAVSIILAFTQWPGTLVPLCLLSGAGLLTVGVCGIERQRPCFSRIGYRLLAVLGAIWLMLFLAVFYLDSVDAISFLEPLYPTKLNWLIPYQLSGVLFGIVICGVLFFTVGILGIGGEYFRNLGELYTAGAVLVISILIFGTMVASIGLMTSPFVFRLRDEITQVDVLSNGPLVLSLDVKAITTEDSRIGFVFIFDSDRNMVAEYYMEDIVVLDEHGYPYNCSVPICVLSGGSSMTLTVRFNHTLPPGNYTVSLASGGFGDDNHGSAAFTIP
jgi:hypothetical protein